MVTTTQLMALQGQIQQQEALVRRLHDEHAAAYAKLLDLRRRVSSHAVSAASRYYGATDAKGAHIDTTA